MQFPFVRFRRGAALACAFAALALLLPAAVRAMRADSRHNFLTGSPTSGGFPVAGGCGACHLPHYGQNPYRIWTRSLAAELDVAAYRQTANPNYIPGATVMCYDCHNVGVPVAVDPPNSVWFTGRPPQDIAIGGSLVGYYETICGQLPGGAVTAPTDGRPTGGHYWKTEPGGTPDYRQGDKIDCSLCHDPHDRETGTNEAMFRQFTWNGSAWIDLNAQNGYGTNLTASANTRDGTGNGRAMCATCHGYSNQGTPQTLYGVTVPRPTVPQPGAAAVPEHASGAATACTDCHGHNQIAGCNECHGYPPLVASAFDRITNPDGQSYAGGAGAHRRHLDALGTAIFDCAICHGPNPGRPTTTWHNQNAVNCGVPVAANVDIMGQTSYWGAGSGYVGVGSPVSPVPAGYAFVAKGGGDQRCFGLTCHGGPPNAAGALNWTDDMVDEATGNPVGDGLSICKWCHDATPARIGAGPWAPNVLGDNNGGLTAAGDWGTGIWGADVNGHGKAAGNYDADAVGEATPGGAPAANKQCTVCHDATYAGTPAAPTRAHFNGLDAENRLRGTINALAAPNEDALCVNCHQNAAGPDSATARSQVSTHGNNFTGAAEGPFTRQCRQCHNVHGANWNGLAAAAPSLGRNLHMVGSWVDANFDGAPQAGEEARVDSNATDATANITAADLQVILTTNSGENSYDDGFNDGQHESVCVVCHRSADMNPVHGPATPPYNNTVESTAFRGAGTHPIGDDCIECHDHDYDNTATTADGFAPSGCNGCHGTNLTETLAPGAIRGQFWPDGSPRTGLPAQYAYADNQAGAHLNHVASIAAQLFGQTPAQVIADPENFVRQKEICVFCHRDPGGAGHFNDDAAAPSGAGRVDVLRGGSATNYFRKYTTGIHPTYGRTNVTTDNTALDSTYNYTSQSCANLVCHNRAPSPTAASPLPGTWGAPPDWSAAAGSCSTTTCHAPATYTNAHLRHVGAATRNYACQECHADNGSPTAPVTPLGHNDGKVDMAWNVAGTVEGVRGGANGFYDKDASGGAVPSAGDTGFAYMNGAYGITCNRIYCHGGDNSAAYPPDWGGAATTPTWNAPTTTYCGSCHDGNGTGPLPAGDGSVTATGNHTDHLTAAYGPRFADPARVPAGSPATSCLGTLTTGCHTNFLLTTATHADGTVQFANIAAAPAASPLGTLAVLVPTATDTDRCSHCHSTASVTVFNNLGVAIGPTSGTALAKTAANWANGAYELPCLTCHNGVDAAANDPNGTGQAAPNMLGTDLAGQSGAEIRGHGLTTGNYPVAVGLTTPNPAANKYCTVCHDKALMHLNNANDTSFAGNRLLGVIEGFTLPVQTSTAVCEACHSRAASTATRRNVNKHTNTDYPLPTASTQGRLEAVFTGPECAQCHEPHGMVFNSAGYNIYMVAPTITVAAGTTVPNVRFEAVTGNYSFNDTLGTPNDDICAVCHVHAANPGTPMFNVTGDGRHYVNNNPSAPLAFYDNDERGRNCSGCHLHNRDNVLATGDGFMPVACNSCHTYPGLANLGAPTHLNSATHNIHAGDPVTVPVNNYAFRCRTCHFQNNHNQTGMSVGGAWSVPNSSLNIRFDPARNGGSPTYAGANASTGSAPGVGGTGVCAALYCHGNGTNGTNGGNLAFPAGFQGSDITPQWSDAASGNCGTCHEIAGSTPPVGTVAHPMHADPFASGGYAIGCQVCHYGTTTNGTTVPAASMPIHVNGSVEVSFNAAADTRVSAASTYNNAGNTAIGAPYYDCSNTYCHSRGSDRAAPYDDPDAAPAQALAWNQSANCGACHGFFPGYADRVDIDGTPKGNKHPIHYSNNSYIECYICHNSTQNAAGVVNRANHVNQTYTVDVPGTLPNTDLYYFTYTAGAGGVNGTCGTTNCHGGRSGVAWALDMTQSPYSSNDNHFTCDICHATTAGVAATADVNNFQWGDPDGSGAGRPAMSKTHQSEYNNFGHGKAGVAIACAACHDSTVDHDDVLPASQPGTLSGANPYRLTSPFTCTDTSSCHTGANSRTVRTHSNTEMVAAGIATQRTWPWVTMCVNCHDPHGDGANLTMVQREIYDKAPFPLTGSPPAAPTEQTTLAFTDRSTGIGAGSFAWATQSTPNYSGICQECHELAPGSGGLVSFHDGPSGGTTVGINHPANPGRCTDCHRHDAAFAPSGCEGCHNVNAYDPGGGRAVAPNVMGDGVQQNGDSFHTTPKPFDDGSFGYNVNGHGRDSDTSSESGGRPIDVACDACHNISVPAGAHLNGTLEGRTPVLGNTNPFHLVTGFINASPASQWSAQVTFDNYCWTACHQGQTRDMRHVRDSDPAAGAMQMGQHNSYATPLNTPPPYMYYDVNLSWLGAFNGAPHFALCVTCHNPHGTNVPSPRGDGNNKMVIYRWEQPPILCAKCHP